MTQTLETTANPNSYYEAALMSLYTKARQTVNDKEDISRLQRGLQYALDGCTHQIDDETWESKNGDGQVYTINTVELTCSCPDYKRRNEHDEASGVRLEQLRWCKHQASQRLISGAMREGRDRLEADLNGPHDAPSVL